MGKFTSAIITLPQKTLKKQVSNNSILTWGELEIGTFLQLIVM